MDEIRTNVVYDVVGRANGREHRPRNGIVDVAEAWVERDLFALMNESVSWVLIERTTTVTEREVSR